MSGDSNSAADDEASSIACVVDDSEAVQNEDYNEFLAIIISEHPDIQLSITTAGSSARKSLCWLVYDDAYNMFDLTFDISTYQVVQRFALGLIYFHFIGGEGANTAVGDPVSALTTSNWLSGVPVCKWDFVFCKSAVAENVVIGLLFVSKKLSGRIPTELALLTNLKRIDFAANFLTGTIPSQLWTMTQLEAVNLRLNTLEGTFPTEVIKLGNLKELSFGNGVLTGTIPDLSPLTDLVLFHIAQSHASGSFPNMSALTNIGEFIFSLQRLPLSLPNI
jgi:hypothetical protein